MAVAVAAGCLAPSNPIASEPPQTEDALTWIERALIFPEGHNHRDPDEHAGRTSRNIDELAWNPLASPHYDGATMPGYSCSVTDPRGPDEGRPRMMYTISYASDVAFVAIDVSDAAAPKWVSEFLLPNAHTDDVRLTPDGRYVVIGSERKQTPDGPGLTSLVVPGSVRTSAAGCNGGILPPDEAAPPDDHLYVVDVENPAAPTYVTSTKIPHPYGAFGGDRPFTGPHMVKVGAVGGRTYVFAFVTFGTLYGPHPTGGLGIGGWGTSRVYVYELTAAPNVALQYVSQIAITPQVPLDATSLSVVHDGGFQVHPVTGENLLYVAAWDDGLVIFNIDDPAFPREVGRWTDYRALDPYEASGNIHHVLPLEGLRDGRHYTIIGPENLRRPQDAPSGWTWVMDTTDPTNPTVAGKWRLPIDPAPEGWKSNFLYSPHFVRMLNESVLVMAHFHGGAWFMDLSDPTHPRELGMFMPYKVPDNVFEGRRVLTHLPSVVDVEVTPDAVFVLEWQSGVYAIRFDHTREP